MTPMMKQYYELKDQCPNAILFFRMGDFYEMFGDDAELAAPKLEIALTSRERGDAQRIPFCGVPHHSAQNYWLKLLRLGYKVAIADQVEDAAQAKGLVKRAIIKIMSPGCIEDLEGLDNDSPNYTMAIFENPTTHRWACSLADISTGEFRVGMVKDLVEITQLVEINRPKELLLRRFCRKQVEEALGSYCQREQLLFQDLPEAPLRDQKLAETKVTEIFGKNPIPKADPSEMFLTAALLSHFDQLQIKLSRFTRLRPLADPQTLTLTETVVRDLELFETARRRQAKGSLFAQINETLTPMGSRLLRNNLLQPFAQEAPIKARHELVQALMDLGVESLIRIRSLLKGIFDLERLNSRLVSQIISPTELAKLRDGLRAAKDLAAFWESLPPGILKERFAKELPISHELLSLLDNALLPAPGSLGKGSEVFAPEFDELLKAKLEFSRFGEEKVEAYQNQLRKETGINNLKIKGHKSFGLLIEITRSQLTKVPSAFIRRQTMVNNERFVTEELQELDLNLASALEQAIERESQLYESLLAQITPFHGSNSHLAQVLGEIDVIQGFAWTAKRQRYCRPKLDTGKLWLDGARHPVVENVVGSHAFTPNHLHLSNPLRHALITGPNMAGKSTVMRQTAICALLNQIGSFIPAQTAVLPVFDQIFTRVGASDDLSLGMSTFMVEMSESAHILRQATARSLVILDEVGRGTSSEDGLAIAKAIFEHLVSQIKCWSMFATHYHEMVGFSAQFPSVSILQTEVVEEKTGIRFTHRLIPGASGSSFGLEVAGLAGVLPEVILKAKAFLNSPEPSSREMARPRERESDTSLKPFMNEISEKLNRLHLNRMSPIQAWNTLEGLQQILQGKLTAGQPSLFPDGQN